MIEIEEQLWAKMVVHEVIHYDYEELIKLSSIGIPPSGLGHGLRWAEGVLFRYAQFPPSEAVIKEQLKGIIHVASIEWTEMPEFKDVIIITETNVKIPVINCSDNIIQKAIAEYLKKSCITKPVELPPLFDAEK
jgi:hypothetical protein